jgi:hypothetical protein
MNVVDKILEIETRKLMGYPGLETRPTVPVGTPTAGTEALKEPWVDPTAAFAGGAGGVGYKAAKGGASVIETLLRALIGGASGAATEYPVGQATDFVEDVNPALAMPFSLATGMVGGGLVDTLANAVKRNPKAMPKIIDVLANDDGMVEAWHGSPHKFDKFDSSKIGTGEGVQAFGHGLYFTDKEEIARHYANKLGKKPNSVILDGKEFSPEFPPLFDEAKEILKNGGTKEDVINRAEETLERIKSAKPTWALTQETINDQYKRLSADIEKIKSGDMNYQSSRNLYKVTINKGKDDVWLDWDKPVGDDYAEKILRQAKKEGMDADDIDDLKDALGRSEGYYGQPETGESLYQLIQDTIGSGKFGEVAELQKKYQRLEKIAQKKRTPEAWRAYEDAYIEFEDLALKQRAPQETSMFLRRAGIDGIRYPTESLSVKRGSDKYNYVVFDDNAVEVNKRIGY